MKIKQRIKAFIYRSLRQNVSMEKRLEQNQALQGKIGYID